MILRFIKRVFISMMLTIFFVAPVYANDQAFNNDVRGKHELDRESEPPTPEMLKEVEEINQRLINTGAKWRAGVTSLTRLSPEERKSRVGGSVLSHEDRKELERRFPGSTLVDTSSSQLDGGATSSVPSFFAPAAAGTNSSSSTAQVSLSELAALAATLTLPAKLDYRNYNGYNYVTSVKDQICANCWAYASTAALESRVLLDLEMHGVDLDLSESLATFCSGYGTCMGGSTVTDFFVNTGLSPESFYPQYWGWEGRTCSDASPGWQLDTYKITGTNQIQWCGAEGCTVEGVKAALYAYGPMYVSMVFWMELTDYSGGVYSWSGHPQSYISHAMELIGYDDENSCFIMKNSNGTNWGEEGFFRVSYASVFPVLGAYGFAYTGAYHSQMMGSDIGYPHNNAALAGTNYTVFGAAFPNQGSTLQGVDVSTDGGTSWHRATDYAGNGSWRNWQYNWNFSGDGAYTIKSRAVDNDGTVETPSAGHTVWVDNTPPMISSFECYVNSTGAPLTGSLDGAVIDRNGLYCYGIANETGSGLSSAAISTDAGAWEYARVFGGASPIWFEFTWIPTTFGPHQINFRLTDRAGNVGPIYTANVTAILPGSTITAPANGASVHGTSLVITGTAVDAFGVGLQKVEVSTDGGATWALATGTTNWSYTWTFPVVQGATYNILSRVTDNSGFVETPGPGVTIRGNMPPSVTANCGSYGYVGVVYSCTLNASGGAEGPYTWIPSIMPDWLFLDVNAGVINGIPSSEGYYPVGVQAQDSLGLISDISSFGIQIYPAMTISTTTLPTGVVNFPYTNRSEIGTPIVYLYAQGGLGCMWEGCNPRYIWSSSTLPAGIVFDPISGILSGTPTVVGTFDITFQIIEPASGDHGSKTLQLVINPVEITDNGLAAGVLNKPYSDTLSAIGTAPFTWFTDNLPSGITINPGSGVLSGTPTAPGMYQVSVQVTDATAATMTKQLELSISDIAEQWVRTIVGDNGEARRTATDAAGNIYVLASFYNLNSSGTNDLLLRKFTPTGTEAWSLIIDDGEDSPVEMVLDSSNIYLLNNVYDINTGMNDSQIVKVTSSGTIQSKISMQINDSANLFTRDIVGNFYVTTQVYGATSDIKIFKYDASGAQLWAAIYDSGDEDWANAMTVDSAGNIYLAGGRWGAEGSNNGSQFVKLDPSGNQLWATVYRGANGENWTSGIAADSIGNVYATGESYSASQEGDVQTLKFDASGNLLWASIYDRIGKYDRGRAVVLDGKGNLYVAGNSDYRTMDNRDFLIMKYDTAGNIVWSKNYNTQEKDDDQAYSIALDQNDHLVIIGSGWNSALGINQVTTVKYFRTDLAITTTSLARVTTNISYSQQLVGEHGLTPYTWAASNLPAGFAITNTGLISGSSTTTVSRDVTVQLTDTSGIAVSKVLTLDIYPPLVIPITSCPTGTLGVAYTCTLKATGGKIPYDWSVLSGSLPAGLSLNNATGVVYGMPSAAGTSNFTAQVSDGGAVATKALSLKIVNAVFITTTKLQSGIFGRAYSQNLSAVNGTLPYTWSVPSGKLPTGLTLSSASGVISGTPRSYGTFSFTVQAKPVSGATASKALSIVIQSSGTLWAWGDNSFGQFGNGTTTSSNTPTVVGGLANIVAIGAGDAHAGAVLYDGSVWAWGRNSSGQVGDGTTISRLTPVPVSGLTNAIAITGSYQFLSALKNDGTVWVWGSNTFRALWDSTDAYKATPVQANGLTNIVTIASGFLHLLALKNDGSLWAWGWNRWGQLGNGNMISNPVPAKVKDIVDVVAIAAGIHHSVALKNDGTVWAWGNNQNGQLGDGTTINHITPVQVSGIANVVAIACGPLHTLALKSDGTVWAWGNNSNGQLGDGTTENRTVPVQIQGLSGIVSISAKGGASSGGYSNAIKSDGTVWAWGINGNGELGDGTTTDRPSPIKITGLTNVKLVSSGGLNALGLTVSPLSVLPITLPNGVINVPYSQTLIPVGGQQPYSWTITGGALSSGLTLSASTGVISGKPTSAGTSTFTVQVKDLTNATSTRSLSISVYTSVSITTTALASGTTGSAYSQNLTASGGLQPYLWSTSSGTLPLGLSLNSSSGLIFGTPTSAGTSTVTFKVTDANSTSSTKALGITIVAPLSISTSTLVSGTKGTSYNQILVATGGKSPYTWSRTAGFLPAGLSLSTAGVISGTSTTTGTSTFTVQVKDANNAIASKSLSIQIYAPLSITTSTLPAGTRNTAYNQTLGATGGLKPYSWSVSTGSLPTGITLNSSTGVISGTPTTAATYNFTVKVTDANAKTATKALSIKVN